MTNLTNEALALSLLAPLGYVVCLPLDSRREYDVLVYKHPDVQTYQRVIVKQIDGDYLDLRRGDRTIPECCAWLITSPEGNFFVPHEAMGDRQRVTLRLMDEYRL